MLHIKIKTPLLILLSSFAFLSGCYKDRTVILESGPEITRTVSFSNDIIPIFNKSCNLSGCHAKSGQVPDLTPANAFKSLTIGNYIDHNNAINSLLYLKLTGKKGTPMPVTGINKDYNSLVIAWIKQGAKNN